MLSVHCTMFHLLYFVLQTGLVRIYKPHKLLLSACLHFRSLKMKFIYSIITHFSKLFPLPAQPASLSSNGSPIMNGRWVPNRRNYLSLSPGGEKAEKKRKDKKQEQKIRCLVYFMSIHWQILDGIEKCSHLWDQSCNYFQDLMSTSLPSLLAGFRQNKTSPCTVQCEELEAITCCRRQAVLIS